MNEVRRSPLMGAPENGGVERAPGQAKEARFVDLVALAADRHLVGFILSETRRHLQG